MVDMFNAPEAHYIGVGRVSVAGTFLESIIGAIATRVGGPSKGRDFPEILGYTGASLRALGAYLGSAPDPNLQGFYDEAEKVLLERHKLVHSLVINLSEPNADQDWVLVDVREDDVRRLPAEAEYEELVQRIRAVASRGAFLFTLIDRLADSLRTSEAPDA